MSGKGYLLDTNAIIQFLKGNSELVSILADADFIATSIIAEMEYYSFPRLIEEDVSLYQSLRSRILVYDVPSDDPIFTQLVVNARTNLGMKLPDAIIAATARTNNLSVLTADDHFKKLKSPWKVRFYTAASEQPEPKGRRK
jgi:hypothetical protein